MARTRDQDRAAHAYNCVRQVPTGDHKDYKILVNALGPHVVRSGLAATMSYLERQKERSRPLLEHLAGAGIPGLPGPGPHLPDQVRALELEAYMLATRDFLKVALWFKRAVQAEMKGDGES